MRLTQSVIWRRQAAALFISLCASVSGLMAVAGTATAAELTPKTLTANGYEFTYVEQGEGPLMVMVHGALSDYRKWLPQMRLLAKHFHVVSFTQRYYGKEGARREGPALSEDLQADDIAAFVKALGKGPAHLVGHSMGARNAHLVTIRHPDIVRSAYLYEGLVNLAPPAEPTDDYKQMMAKYGAAWDPVSAAIKANDLDTAARKLIENVSGDAGFFDRQSADAKLSWQDNSPGMARFFVRKRTVMPCQEMAVASKVPTLVVLGTESVVATGIPLDAFASLYKDCLGANVRRETIQGATHMWPDMEPAKFVESVRAFASGL